MIDPLIDSPETEKVEGGDPESKLKEDKRPPLLSNSAQVLALAFIGLISLLCLATIAAITLMPVLGVDSAVNIPDIFATVSLLGIGAIISAVGLNKDA